MYTRDIRQWIGSLKDGDLILAKQAYEQFFSQMKEATFYQLLARLCDEKTIGKVAKGLYYKPFKDDYDELPTSASLVSFFTNKHKNGILVGQKMLQSYNIVSEDCDVYQIYTGVFEIKSRRCIRNLEIKNIDVDYRNDKIVKTIEALEIIEIIDNYENVNYENLKTFFEEYASIFDQAVLAKVLYSKSYKKRNIATLKRILDHFKVSNSLQKQLNTASKYDFPKNIAVALGL